MEREREPPIWGDGLSRPFSLGEEETDSQTDSRTDKPDSHTDGQTDRQTDREGGLRRNPFRAILANGQG